MTLEDRLDICEAIYGKLTKAAGIFYWTENKYHLVNIETGEDMLSHIDHERMTARVNHTQISFFIRMINSRRVKILDKAIAIVDSSDCIVLYALDGKPLAKVKKRSITANNIEEYVTKDGKLAIYILGKSRASGIMLLGIVDLVDNKVVQFINNCVKLFKQFRYGETLEKVLEIVTLNEGKLDSIQYTIR